MFGARPRLGGWQLSPLCRVVPRPGVAHARMRHLEVGDHGKLATLDNALSRFAVFTPSRARWGSSGAVGARRGIGKPPLGRTEPAACWVADWRARFAR